MFSVSGSFLSVVDEWLVANGFSASSVNLRIRQLKQIELVPMREVETLLEEVIEITNDGNVFLKIGQSVSWGHLGTLGHMLRSARTLEELLVGYVFYEKLFYGKSTANVERSDQSVKLYWKAAGISIGLAQLTMSTFESIVKRLVDHNQAVLEIGFPFDDYFAQQDYKELFNNKFSFNEETLFISFRKEFLFKELSFTNIESNQFFPDSSILNELPEGEFRDHLFSEVVAAIPMRNAKIESVSKTLAMSPRTLQRRLVTVPDGFRGVVYRIRMYLAQYYLLDMAMSLASISLLLGYSEQSAFHLAFKKHFHKTPSEWRLGLK